MHTLIIMQNDAKIRGADPKLGREQTVPFGFPGVPKSYRLKVHHVGSPVVAAAATLGGAGSALGAAYLSSANRIKRTIIEFASVISGPPTVSDVAEFQIIFIFHQTSADTAKAVTAALNALPLDQGWLRLPYRHSVAIRVIRAWLLSCESGTDQVTSDPGMQRYIDQALNMRLAAAVGLTTEKTPPPSTPPEYWLPFIYTFSTGDPYSGGIVVNPFKVSFRKLPCEADPNGGWRDIPKPPNDPRTDDEYKSGEPVAGKVYKYEGTRLIEERTIPANGSVNLLQDAF